MERQERIAGLDLMKVLGLYLVILYHLTFRSPANVRSGGLGDYVVFFLTTFMSICVPLFFTASGALSLTRPLDLRKNGRRCVHLAVLLLVWLPVSMGVILALRREMHGVLEALSLGWSLSYDYVQHLWYLCAFLLLSLFLPALHTLRRSSRRVFRYSLVVLMVLTFGNLLLNDLEYLLRWAMGRYGHTGTRQFFGFVNIFRGYYWYAFVYLALGAYLLERREALRRFRWAAAAAIPLCMLALTLSGIARSRVQDTVFDPVLNNYGSIFTLGITASVGLLLLQWEPGPGVRRVSASVGRCSLGIYLVHWLLIEALRDYLPGVFSAVALAPLTALALLGLSWAVTWCALRVPGVRNLFTAAPDWVRG